MILQNIYDKGLIPGLPKFLLTNTHYLTIMGSQSYGTNNDDSDTDIYGFGIPPKEMIFPHLAGEIMGFSTPQTRFKHWEEHHIMDGKKEYDFSVYSIINYFRLLMGNNPNVLDSIWTPINCVVHCTSVGQMVRDNRKMFMHKGLFHKFRGYSFSQLHKMETKDPKGKRKAIRDKYGWDVKFGMNVVRILLEAEQLLETGELDLQRYREMLKSIRRGEWTAQQVKDWFATKEKHLDGLYQTSKLPYGPDEEKIKELLLNCLEQHFGSLDKAIVVPNKLENALKQIKDICDKATT